MTFLLNYHSYICGKWHGIRTNPISFQSITRVSIQQIQTKSFRLFSVIKFSYALPLSYITHYKIDQSIKLIPNRYNIMCPDQTEIHSRIYKIIFPRMRHVTLENSSRFSYTLLIKEPANVNEYIKTKISHSDAQKETYNLNKFSIMKY